MSISSEESNFLRFYYLNLKVASKAVRAYFDSVHPPTGLAGELGNSSTVTKLKGLRFITNQQLTTLYPNPVSNVKSEHFDTSLIVCLLRNMQPRESAPVTGWNNLPNPSDTSTGADLARVKWYRNKLAHHEDGKLCPVEYSQYWGDLESAISRLGGPSMLKESQSAQHIVLDKSLKDILNIIRNCEKDIHNLQVSQDKHTIMINDHQTTIDHQESVREQHEKKIQLLNVSIQKGKAEVLTLTTEVSEYKGSIEKCKEMIETSKKEIDMIEVTIKGIQEKAMHTQNQVGDFTHQLYKLECKSGNKFKEIDEQLATFVKEIDNIKKEQHNEDVISDTNALIDADIREGTFVTIKAVSHGLSKLKQNGVLLMTGHAGTGKSRIGLHILHLFCNENSSYKCIKLNTLKEWEKMVNRQNNVIVLLDDIFGPTNCDYNRERDTPILEKIHAYVLKGNIKIIITIRDTVKRQCLEVLDNHRVFKFDFIDLSSDKYKLSNEEKHDILTMYMKTVRKSDYLKAEGFTDCNGVTILSLEEVRQIETIRPVQGFPLAVYQFVYNNRHFQLGSKFFDRTTEAILEEINELRRKGEDNNQCMIQYAVMVYTAVNENRINPDDSANTFAVEKIINAIYGKIIKLKKINISDSVKDLFGSYLVNIENQRSYRFHHPTLQESVIISFAQIDDKNLEKIIPVLSWPFFLKMVKSYDYKEKEGEVVLRIPKNSFKLMADRLVTIYEAKIWNNIANAQHFIHMFIFTEIFLQENFLLLVYLLEALEKEDHNDKVPENMIKSNALFSCYLHLKRKNVFMATLLVTIVKMKNLDEVYNFVLQKFNQVIITCEHYFSIDYMKAVLVSSMYECCSTKDLRSVKSTFDLVEKNEIPVLLDQSINLSNIRVIENPLLHYVYDHNDTRCIFLTLCIWEAYQAFNVPVLEFLLSKYNRTPFDVNLFFNMIYSNQNLYRWLKKISYEPLISNKPPISCKPLKWMIDRFSDSELVHTDFILRAACQLQMIDTVEYLASRSITFDVISCLKVSLGVNDNQQVSEYFTYNKNLLNFLLSRIDSSSIDLTPTVLLVLQKSNVPDYVFDTLLHLCLNNVEILTMACRNAHVYIVKQLMDKDQNVDIQTALISTCMKSDFLNFSFIQTFALNIEDEKLEIVKYIFETFGYEKIDLKAAYYDAYNSSNFKIIEWFVQNIDITMLDVYFIIKSALTAEKPEMLQHIMTRIDMASLDKIKVLKCVTEHYNVRCCNNIIGIFSSIWESTVNKEDLKIEEIVDIAYTRKGFKLLMWIHEKCNSHISIDARKLLFAASENCRIDIANWVLINFEKTSLDIDEKKLFVLACANRLDCKRFDMVKWILNSFKINPSDLRLGLLKLICSARYVMQENLNFIVDISEQYPNCLSLSDIEVMMGGYLNMKHYQVVNWFLEHKSSCSFDKQTILNTACKDRAIETIKILTQYFRSLDLNQAMIHACTPMTVNIIRFTSYDNNQIACLDLLWREIDRDSIDINRIVSSLCKVENIDNNVMTWVLLNLPHSQIPINQLLITCCQQSKINHVMYIFHEEDNKQLNLKEAFIQACKACSVSTQYGSASVINFKKTSQRTEITEGMLVDYLFKKLHDKTSNLSIVINDIVAEEKYDLLLYFLEEGYFINIDINSLMKQACRHGNVKLVQWILENVEQTELDIKPAFFEACNCIEHKELDTKFASFKKNSVVNVKKQLHCLSLIWHYIQDIEIFEMDTVLKAITDVPPEMSSKYDDLRTWLQYVKNITAKSESATLNY